MKTKIFVSWYSYSLNDEWCVVSDIPPREEDIIARTKCHMQAVHIVATHNDWLKKVKDAAGLNAIDALIAEAVENIVENKESRLPGRVNLTPKQI